MVVALIIFGLPQLLDVMNDLKWNRGTKVLKQHSPSFGRGIFCKVFWWISRPVFNIFSGDLFLIAKSFRIYVVDIKLWIIGALAALRTKQKVQNLSIFDDC